MEQLFSSSELYCEHMHHPNNEEFYSSLSLASLGFYHEDPRRTNIPNLFGEYSPEKNRFSISAFGWRITFYRYFKKIFLETFQISVVIFQTFHKISYRCFTDTQVFDTFVSVGNARESFWHLNFARTRNFFSIFPLGWIHKAKEVRLALNLLPTESVENLTLFSSFSSLESTSTSPVTSSSWADISSRVLESYEFPLLNVLNL